MEQYYVGLDVHSKESVFVIQNGDGTVVAQGAVPTTPTGLQQLRKAQALPAGTPVALESGTVAFFVARQLTALGLAPLVVDAHEVRLKARRPTQKSDRRNRAGDAVAADLRRVIDAARASLVPPTAPARPAGVDPETQHRLRELGYVE